MQRPSGTGHVARMSDGEEAWLERGGRRGGGQGYTTQAADLQETSASQQRQRGHRRALRRGVAREPGSQFAEVTWLPVYYCRRQRPEGGGVCTAGSQAGGRAAEWRWRAVSGFETPRKAGSGGGGGRARNRHSKLSCLPRAGVTKSHSGGVAFGGPDPHLLFNPGSA